MAVLMDSMAALPVYSGNGESSPGSAGSGDPGVITAHTLMWVDMPRVLIIQTTMYTWSA